MSKVIVYVEGGVVQTARSNDPDIELEVFDYDNKKDGQNRAEIENEWSALASDYSYIIY